jgi:hypothetical protein
MLVQPHSLLSVVSIMKLYPCIFCGCERVRFFALELLKSSYNPMYILSSFGSMKHYNTTYVKMSKKQAKQVFATGCVMTTYNITPPCPLS